MVTLLHIELDCQSLTGIACSPRHWRRGTAAAAQIFQTLILAAEPAVDYLG